MTSRSGAQSWQIDPDQAGARLDVFLTEHMTGKTRSSLQKMIKAESVLVNGKPATVHRFLKSGDVIEYRVTRNEDQRGRESPKTIRDTRYGIRDTGYALRIIDEAPDWIVIDKPAGLLVHPDAKQKTGTLVDLLLAYDPKIAKVGEDPERPGIVHRLDREVSGLMLVARTERAYEALQTQMKQRRMEKTYLALVHGRPPEEMGDIKFRIARSSTQPRMAARPVEQAAGRAAWTHYRVLKRFRGATLVEADIMSGRTHQIRAHFHALGCPIIGDPLYHIKKTERNLKAPRLMLQSVRLSFEDPVTGERKRFVLAPVEAFADVEVALGAEERV